MRATPCLNLALCLGGSKERHSERHDACLTHGGAIIVFVLFDDVSAFEDWISTAVLLLRRRWLCARLG